MPGRLKNKWQNRVYVLRWFGKRQGEAKKRYQEYAKKGITLGARPDLVGGGSVRLLGGWPAVNSTMRQDIKEKGDERILGSTEFFTMIKDLEKKAPA